MPTRLKFQRASTPYFLLTWKRDGALIDLTGATLSALLLETPGAPEASALASTTGDAPALAFTWRADEFGQACLAFTAAATSALSNNRAYYWFARATLANGDVVFSEAHHGPLFLTPYLGSPLDGLWGDAPPVDGVTQTLVPGGDITLLPPAMANYVQNLSSLTRLLGGSSVALDGIRAESLALLTVGAKITVAFTGKIDAHYILRARITDEVESAPWIILADNNAGLTWELRSVTKEGTPCLWDATLSKFRQVLIAEDALTLADEADAFVLPT